jgi:hypothetical protein
LRRPEPGGHRAGGIPSNSRPDFEPFSCGIFVHSDRRGRDGQRDWLFWHPDLDPSVVQVRAEQVSPSSAGAFDLSRFADRADWIQDQLGHEWLLLSDGIGEVQLEITKGTLGAGPVALHFEVTGFHNLLPKLRTLARLEALHRLGRFPRSLFSVEAGAVKWSRALQAYDGMLAGASQREIAVALMGEAFVREEWNCRSDFLRARVQRLLQYGRKMVNGGYKAILGKA